MDDLKALYQEVIIDHSRNPRNFGCLESANCSAEGVNPLCGDELTLQCLLDADDVIQEIRFVGHGCAISVASASIMTEMMLGMSKTEAEQLFERFHARVTGCADGDSVDIGKLEVLSGVREFPTRVKCATLAWHTAIAAINRTDEQVTTE
ncbi:MAG: SUF system NifU family Fe-S cluster assembly protein [Acidiferrobacterales bacterium]|nr:SUF system NifU family Fe-S cluster assembly protein [Acidiferrobacterales bacterium]